MGSRWSQNSVPVPVELAYSLYKRYKSKGLSWVVTSRKYDSEIDPFRLLWVSLDRIEQKQRGTRDIANYPMYVSEVQSGDWDERTYPFCEGQLYEAFVEHFERGVKWTDTDWVERTTREIVDQGLSPYGCESQSKFYDRLEYIDTLYESIRENGYKTQRELIHGTNGSTGGHWWAYFCPELHEITVNIGRDGELIFASGRHRFAIVKTLGVDEIPVRVKLGHEQWQRRRDQVVKKEPTATTADHPDVEYL